MRTRLVRNAKLATLQVSIGLPPPKLISESASTRTISASSSPTTLRGTCWRAPLKTAAQREPIAPVTCASSRELPSDFPVTTMARCNPRRSSSSPSAAIFPGHEITRSSLLNVNSALGGFIGAGVYNIAAAILPPPDSCGCGAAAAFPASEIIHEFADARIDLVSYTPEGFLTLLGCADGGLRVTQVPTQQIRRERKYGRTLFRLVEERNHIAKVFLQGLGDLKRFLA